MPSLTPESRSQLLSRLRTDQAEHWRRGERVPVEHYLAEHPDLGGDADAVLTLLHAEITLRLERGERPSLDEYLGRFPHLADVLRGSWPHLQPTPAPPGSESGGSYSTTREESSGAPPPRPAAAAPSLPGLELHEKLGQGGMGVVYRARDVRLDQPRAVKLIRPGPFAGEQEQERFQREARAAARLDHPGVVRVYTLGEHGDTLYICMEFLEGGSLRDRLRQGPLEVRAAAELVRQLARAVQHAHDHCVLHRDLKPANVLLTADGTPKVADFGLAKLLDADDDLTQTGAVVGTPSYMAPEQAEGQPGGVGGRADVWALGVILYECLTGRPPFKGTGRGETLELVKTQPPVPPRRLRAEVPAELEAICLKCLEKDPARRYPSAAALADDLGAWLDGRPTGLRPARGVRRLTRGLRRRPRRALAAALVLLAGLAAALIGYFGHPDYPLWQEQARLRRGEAVELLGATGKPRWSRWWVGEQDAGAVGEPDGTFVVHGWPVTLLELLPDTGGHRNYRLRAEMRHLRGSEHSAIGLYFAATRQHPAGGPVFSFLQVEFNDLEDAMDLFNRFPPAQRRGMRAPRGNTVPFLLRYHDPRADSAIQNESILFAEPELFKPAGIGHAGKPGDWRTLQVEVSPTRLRAFWDDKLVGDLGPARVEAMGRQKLEQLRRLHPQDPTLARLDLRLDLQGGLGLYLFESYASFRNVRVEPLDDAADAP